jgi:hypothetical protein
VAVHPAEAQPVGDLGVDLLAVVVQLQQVNPVELGTARMVMQLG